MSRRIDVRLSASSIDAAIRELESYRSSFEGRLDELCRRLAQLGMEVAVRNIPVYTGDLKSSVRVEHKGPRSWAVVSDSDHAAFVEFGTGVVGEGTYKGELPEEWGYDERRTPSAHSKADPTVWYYFDPVAGEVRHTRGQAGKGYMLAASQEMRRQAAAIAREVFGA